MKRNAFTLVELIFVIVIIGVLAAVAVPKFKNLKQNAEVKAVIKTTMDTAQSAVSAAVNKSDLDENASYQLNDLVDVTGKGWIYNNVAEKGSYTYSTASGVVSTISFDRAARTVNYAVDCANFVDAISQSKCISDLNTTAVSGVDVNKTITY